LSMRKVEERVIAKGFTRDQWQTAVMEYTNLDVSFTLPSSLRVFTDMISTDLANSRQWHTPYFHRLGSCGPSSRRGVRHGVIASLVDLLKAWSSFGVQVSVLFVGLCAEVKLSRQKRALSLRWLWIPLLC
jgi:hypothetical protein